MQIIRKKMKSTFQRYFFEAKCTYLYSKNELDTQKNTEVSDVSEIYAILAKDGTLYFF